MTPGEIRDRSSEELARLVQTMEEEIFRLHFRKGTGQLKQTANIRKARKDLARVRTVLTERSMKERGNV